MWHIIDKGRENTVREKFYIGEDVSYCVIRTDEGDEPVGERNMNGYTDPESRDICAFDFTAGGLLNCNTDNTILFDPSIVLDVKPSSVQGDNPSYMRCNVQFQPEPNLDDLKAYMSKIGPFLARTPTSSPPPTTTTTVPPPVTTPTPTPTTTPSRTPTTPAVGTDVNAPLPGSGTMIDPRDITGTVPVIFDSTTSTRPPATTLVPTPITPTATPTVTPTRSMNTTTPSVSTPITTTTTMAPTTTYRPMNATTLSTVIETRGPSTTRPIQQLGTLFPFQQPLPSGNSSVITNAPAPSLTTTKRPSRKTTKPPKGAKVNTPSSRITIVTAPPIMQTPGSNSALNLNIINKSSSGKSKNDKGSNGGAAKKGGKNRRDNDDEDEDDWEEFASWRRGGGGCAGGCGGGGCCGSVCCGGHSSSDSSSSSDSDSSSDEEEKPDYEWNGMDMPPVVLIDDQTWGWKDMAPPGMISGGFGGAGSGGGLGGMGAPIGGAAGSGTDMGGGADGGDTGDMGDATADDTSTPEPDASTSETALGPASVSGGENDAKPSAASVVTPSELPEIPQDRSKWKYEIVDGKFTLNGTPLVLKGVNWHGFENQEFFPQPLWLFSMESGFKELANNGVNAVRVPVSAELMMHIANPDLIIGGTKANPPKFAKQTDINFDKDCDLKPMSVAFDKFMKLAYKYNMLVMVDLHNFRAAPPDNADSSNGSFEFPQEVEGVLKTKVSFPKATITKLWAEFAKYLSIYPHVFGADLKNEPHIPSWSDWSKAATEYGRAVLAANPHLFIVVEGVNEAESGYGGALSGAKTAPVDVGVPNKVIYSPHRYGPGLRDDIPLTDEKSWDKHFGYLIDMGYCVMMGEWGIGKKDDYEFNKNLAKYMATKGIHGFYWTFSYTSKDTLNIIKQAGTTETKLMTNAKSYEVMEIAANKNATKLKFPT